MSYCVNCGVELDVSLETCPLCNTPVINPNEIPYTRSTVPFPKEKGQVEVVKRKDLGILLTIVLVTTAVTCGLLNVLVFNGNLWSVLVAGVCMILWVLCIPFVIYPALNVYAALLFDGLSVGLYLHMITFLTESEGWYWGLALPITVLVTVLIELFALGIRKIPRSFLTTTLFVFIGTAVLCVGIELLIPRYQGNGLRLSWSAVVLTVCVIIIILLATLLSRRRLRDAVRRRLHF